MVGDISKGQDIVRPCMHFEQFVPGCCAHTGFLSSTCGNNVSLLNDVSDNEGRSGYERLRGRKVHIE